jgi:uncharacterized SAM-binding protein YcdF (DUF218 family)
MIDAFVDAAKLFARPASLTFFIALLAIGVALSFWRKTQRGARWYFAGVLVSYWVIASPACAERLVRWQGRAYRPLASAAESRGSKLVVVLGAGNSTMQFGDLVLNQVSLGAALRLLEGARLYRLLDRPTILVSGGVTGRVAGARAEAEAMRDAIVRLGVPADHVTIEAESKTTREEALAIARTLAGQPPQPIVLVTSPTHMTRSLAVFRAAGLDAIPSAAPIKPDHWSEKYRWMPSDFGLLLFDSVVYDTAATLYYRLRGWM